MKKRYFIGLLFGAVLLTGCSGISSTIADMQMKSAKKSMESENYDKAIMFASVLEDSVLEEKIREEKAADGL